MVEKIPQHMHCQICGKAVASAETLCSDECKTQYQALVKKRKTYMYIMYAAIFLMIALLVVPKFLGVGF